ncbi:hypothetical protein [Flavobacterium johnsoniae]|uniref:hypothetical protein n=1 Tax=Flavobacterium johnsoniae TaxID=986 RepID=UPI001659DCFA|nr:hypothetical protein [Flavobacterium johnsoniae]
MKIIIYIKREGGRKVSVETEIGLLSNLAGKSALIPIGAINLKVLFEVYKM